MRKFLIKIWLFSFLTVILLSVGELVVRSQPSSYSYKYGRLKANGNGVNTLILGSSHTYYGLKPDVLGDSVFSLANISQTPEYDLVLLKKALLLCPNLKRVIIPVSYFTFRDPELENGVEWRLCMNYKIHMDVDVHSDFSKYNFYIFDFDTYCGKLRNLVLPQHMNRCDSLGFGLGYNTDSRKRDWQQTGKLRALSLTNPSETRPQEVVSIIEAMLDLCRDANIECILVTTPVWTTFRDNIEEEQYRQMGDLAEHLVQKYGLRYFDFFNSEQFGEEDFYDTDHLSDIGAEHLSRVVRRLLMNSEKGHIRL